MRPSAGLGTQLHRSAWEDMRRLSLTLTLGGAIAAVAFATSSHAGAIDQVWVGAFAHSVTHSNRLEGGTQDIFFEVDTARPRALRALGAPRVGIAIAANTAGHSDLASLGLVWDHQLSGRLYGSVDFGFGVTDGLIRPRAGAQGVSDFETRLLLGSHVLFRVAAGLDWRLSRRWSVGLELVHASNGNLLGSHPYNRGINDAGLRFAYRFD